MAWEEFNPFTSSNLAFIRYDKDAQTLEVSFKNGGVYHYYDVPEGTAAEFNQAESKGKFLQARIKGTHRYSKV